MSIQQSKHSSKPSRRQGPIFVDLMDETRFVEPVGTVQKGRDKGKIICKVYFDENGGKSAPVYYGMTNLPAKLFDDGSAEQHKLSFSQQIGFLIKSASTPS